MKKLYYTIGEVEEITQVEAHVLRYWETTFPSLNPKKNKAGKRVYTEADLNHIMELKELVREKGYSTKGAKDVIKKAKEEPAEDPKVKLPAEVERDLRQVRQFLQNLLNDL